MADDPTRDRAGQGGTEIGSGLDWAAVSLDPTVQATPRRISYSYHYEDDDTITVRIVAAHILAREAHHVLQALATIDPLTDAWLQESIAQDLEQLRISAQRRKQLGGGGQPLGPTYDPEFLTNVITQAWAYRTETEEAPTLDVMPGRLGVGRTAYTDWLKRSRLTSTDIKIAASKRTISDGTSYLRRLQKRRRYQGT
jgi:hypothetical protein